jgi:hypothetical protein
MATSALHFGPRHHSPAAAGERLEFKFAQLRVNEERHSKCRAMFDDGS